MLGAGRTNKEDDVEKDVGISFRKKVGDEVKVGDTLAIVYANSIEKAEKASNDLKDAYSFSIEKTENMPTILGVIK